MLSHIEKGRTSKISDREHFDVLDGLRGIAALMVLLGHASAVMLGAEETYVPRKGLAVTFFFMLSGFVVASAYDKKLLTGMTFYEFMMRRIVRLYPLIILGLIIGAIWFGATSDHFGYKGLLAIAFASLTIPGPLTDFSFSHFPINPPQWSLFFEMVAYVSFALVRLNTRSTVAVVILCSAGFVVVDYYYLLSRTPLFLNLFQVGASFYGGSLLWRAHEAKLIPNIQLPSWVISIPIIVLCLCPFRIGPIVDYAALLIIFPCIIALGAVKGRGAAKKLERLVGDLSYPVYILHWPLLEASRCFIEPLFGAVTAISVAMASTVTFSWAALELYDKPLRKWLSNLFIYRKKIIQRTV